MPWEQANPKAGIVPQDPNKFVGEKKERKERREKGRHKQEGDHLGSSQPQFFSLCVSPKGIFYLGCFPSVFAFTFYCKLLNKCIVPEKSRFFHGGKQKPSRDAQGDKEPCLLLPGSASASVWMIRLADVESTDFSRLLQRFFTWGPGIPNELQGITENPSYCKQHTCIFSPRSP